LVIDCAEPKSRREAVSTLGKLSSGYFAFERGKAFVLSLVASTGLVNLAGVGMVCEPRAKTSSLERLGNWDRIHYVSARIRSFSVSTLGHVFGEEMTDTYALPLTRVEAAVQEIRRRIFDGTFPAGHQLKQEQLAEQFQMSRIPLREAFRQLEAEGLVSIVPHKGAVVSEISFSEIEELFNLRALLECRLLRLSAPRLTDKDFEHLDEILASFESDLSSNRVAKWGEMNTKLHLYLYRHCAQPRTLAIVNNLLQQTDRFTRLQILVMSAQVRVQEQHYGIVLRCRQGLFEEAVELLKSHIESAATSLQRSGVFPGSNAADA